MAEMFSGRDVLTFFRKRANHATEDGTRVRFQSEVTLTEETETESTPTTEGTFLTANEGESTADFTSYAYHDDTETLEMWHELRDLRRSRELMELWIVYNVGSQKPSKAEYMRGYLTSFEMSASADGQVELSFTFSINGTPVTGEETLTEAQIAQISGAYEYESIQKSGTTGA